MKPLILLALLLTACGAREPQPADNAPPVDKVAASIEVHYFTNKYGQECTLALYVGRAIDLECRQETTQ